MLAERRAIPGVVRPGQRTYDAAASDHIPAASLMTDPHEAHKPTQPRPRNRGVYLLPNLFTTAVLFAGFYAVVAAADGNFDRAGIAIFIAMVCDGLDGRIARWTNTQSDFGKEYDSLSDMVAFGVAPAIVAYQWGVARIAEYGSVWGRVGWLATFFYAATAAMRLARFNARAATADKRFFEVLPRPSGAAILAGFVWMMSDWEVDGLLALVLAFAVALITGGLMVSRFPYVRAKNSTEPPRAIRSAADTARLRGGRFQPARNAVRDVQAYGLPVRWRSLAAPVPTRRPATRNGSKPS
jgi:CDP-diacylglycerol--serine O-phosphatidyltransferase